MNRRGFARDSALYIVLLFVVALGIVLVHFVFSTISDSLTDSPLPVEQKQFFKSQSISFQQTWDFVFLTVSVGVMIALLILAYLLRGNPVIFFALVFVVAVMGILAGALSNAFTEISQDTGLSLAFSGMPVIGAIMQYFPMFAIVNVVLMLIIFFGKPGGDF